MIRYSLKCADGHRFDSWFRDSAAYDKLAAAGQVACAVCGSPKVEKTIMAPSVRGGEAPLSKPKSPAEAALAKLRKHIEENSDYVGRDFAAEARRIHDGEADSRAIWGEARLDEAKALHDDGIPVAPIPWITRRND